MQLANALAQAGLVLLQLMRIVCVLMSLFALHGMICLFGMSFIEMALVLAQFSCGLQLGWAAGRITVLALPFEWEFLCGCRRSAFMLMLTWPLLLHKKKEIVFFC